MGAEFSRIYGTGTCMYTCVCVCLCVCVCMCAFVNCMCGLCRVVCVCIVSGAWCVFYF